LRRATVAERALVGEVDEGGEDGEVMAESLQGKLVSWLAVWSITGMAAEGA